MNYHELSQAFHHIQIIKLLKWGYTYRVDLTLNIYTCVSFGLVWHFFNQVHQFILMDCRADKAYRGGQCVVVPTWKIANHTAHTRRIK